MRWKKFLIIFLATLYFDLIFNLFSYDSYLTESIINIFLFSLITSFVIYIVTGVWNDKVNRLFTYIVYIIMPIWYGLHYVFYNLLLTPFSVALFRQTDQALTFMDTVFTAILENIHVLLLLFVPLILCIVFRKRLYMKRIEGKGIVVSFVLLLFVIGVYVLNIFVQERKTGGIHNLYFETNNTSLNIERLGVMAATMLDVERFIFGFEDKIFEVDYSLYEDEDISEYGYNKVEIDLDNGKDDIAIINDYVKNEIVSKKNKYTGMFEGKNLIFVVAESFNEIAVSPELTPTLYKLVHEGFYFKNYYTSNNLSTIGGEFQALTGLYADNAIFSTWRGGEAYFPYGLGTKFSELGYKTYAYHDNNAYFQDRNVYLNSQGLSNYKGCNKGLDNLINCDIWPQSDVEMINATVDDYINSDEPFLTYYMTVSGHFYYTFDGNDIANKNKEYVQDLGYNENVSAYLATQIELDRAMELLLKKLEEASKLDDTVIVLTADHFPYNLDINDINTLSTYERDVMIEANSNNLVIYNSKMNSEIIDKVGMSIDVLPTVLNLFGINYDSRIIMGKDILSDSLGIAIFKDKSWVTDKGTYYASSGEFRGEDVSLEYIEMINNIVSNRTAISKMIVLNDYYKQLFNK